MYRASIVGRTIRDVIQAAIHRVVLAQVEKSMYKKRHKCKEVPVREKTSLLFGLVVMRFTEITWLGPLITGRARGDAPQHVLTLSELKCCFSRPGSIAMGTREYGIEARLTDTARTHPANRPRLTTYSDETHLSVPFFVTS